MAVTSILNNIAALGASYELGITGTGMQDTIQRLTTGKRINKASDDASGLVIANSLTSSTLVDTQGQANANNMLAIPADRGRHPERGHQPAHPRGGTGPGSPGRCGRRQHPRPGRRIPEHHDHLQQPHQHGRPRSTPPAWAGNGGLRFTVTVSRGSPPSPGDLATHRRREQRRRPPSAEPTSADLGTARGGIGAGEESLQSYSNVLGIQMQNQTAQLSQIQDANVANEVVNLTKFQILNQSGISALSKANQAGQSILSLLQ